MTDSIDNCTEMQEKSFNRACGGKLQGSLPSPAPFEARSNLKRAFPVDKDQKTNFYQ
jgi:hypothetical protein